MSVDGTYGVPAVAFHTHAFHAVTKSVVRVAGMPELRQVYVPHPVQGKTPAQMRAYIDGADPITGRSVMQEVIEGLTGALSEADLKGFSLDRSTPRLCEPAPEEELHRLFEQNRWTDFLPIVLPTEERVAEMLRHTSHKPDEVVGHHAPTHVRESWGSTVEKIAVNAVMAGCRPQSFPVVLALAASGVSARGSSSSSMSTMVVVNGPIRHEIDMNAGIGAMGPYNHANATIGRAFGLLSQNMQGGSVPGITYMGSQGNGLSYTGPACAENEERSPWEPLHVQYGFRPDESVVSIFRGCQTTGYMLGLRREHWREHVRYMLRGIDPNSPPCLVLDPTTAQQFIEIAGLTTKRAVIDWMYENGTMPAGEYWDYQLVQNYKYPRATFGEEPWASKIVSDPNQMIPIFNRDEINVVIVGGETNAYWRMVGASLQKQVSVDKWR